MNCCAQSAPLFCFLTTFFSKFPITVKYSDIGQQLEGAWQHKIVVNISVRNKSGNVLYFSHSQQIPRKDQNQQ